MSIDLMKKRVELTKKIILDKGIDTNIKVNMKLLVDNSGSMDYLYNHGVVQDLVERVLAVGMNLDINKSIEVFTFNNGAKEIGTATENNYKGFMRGVHAGGGTNYSPAMNLVWQGYERKKLIQQEKKQGFIGKLFGVKSYETITTTEHVSTLSDTLPTFAVMVTDGENFDRYEAEQVVRESSKDPIFWQFIGIGNEYFNFLRSLDNLSGRVIDNANFFEVSDLEKISDEDLYNKLLTEFPSWVKLAKNAGILK